MEQGKSRTTKLSLTHTLTGKRKGQGRAGHVHIPHRASTVLDLSKHLAHLTRSTEESSKGNHGKHAEQAAYIHKRNRCNFFPLVTPSQEHQNKQDS
jgi:hypothetical protein